MKRLLFPLLCVLVAAIGCNKKTDTEQPPRAEYINVYETSPSKLVSNIQVPFEGVKDGKIHVLSNVPLNHKLFVDPDEVGSDWLEIKGVEKDPDNDKHLIVTYDAASLLDLNSIDRRSWRLSFSSPEHNLGKFLTIGQGYERMFIEEFSGEEGNNLVLAGKESYSLGDHNLSDAYFVYISFNAWAENLNEFRGKNITLDITVSGGTFYDTRLSTFRVNVPLGDAADKSNLQYLMLLGNNGKMSAKTNFSFSVDNDNLVYVHVDNFAAYKVTEAEMGDLFEDEEFNESEEWI